MSSQLRPDSVFEIAVAIAIGTLSVAIPTVLPGLVGILQQGFGFNDSQLGYLSSANLAGMTVGSMLGAHWIPRIGIRRGTEIGLLITAVASAAVIVAGSYWPLLVLLLIGGLGAGLMVTGCYIVLGQSRHVERNFSFYLICQQVLGAAALWGMPALPSTVAVRGVFGTLAGLLIVALLFARHLSLARYGGTRQPDGVQAADKAAWIGLGALLIYYISEGAVWAYLELIGERGGVPRQVVATALVVCTLAALVGAAAAAAIGPRFGRARLVLTGLAAGLASLYLLGSTLSSARFILAACLFNGAWNFSTPYLLASIAAVDRSGNVMSWTASASLAGFSLGPLMAAVALQTVSLTGVLGLSAGLCLISFVAFAPAWRSVAAAR
jgi:MFS transporter, DHA1 family, inner membrane transport protein